MLCFLLLEVTFLNIYDEFMMPLQDDVRSNYVKCMSINAYYSNQVGDYVTFPTVIWRKLCDSFHCPRTYVCTSYLMNTTATNVIVCVCVCVYIYM
jgi:hypothetical protein